MYKGKLIITHQLGETIQGIHELKGNNKAELFQQLKELSSKVESLYSVYSNHTYYINDKEVIPCNWCDNPAEYSLKDTKINFTDHACKTHKEKYFPFEEYYIKVKAI